MSVGDWSQCRVTWGKKHKGKTYHQVLTLDPSYYQWAVARFQSLTPEQQDFVRYCQVQMDLDRRNWDLKQNKMLICLLFMLMLIVLEHG
jgi:hypothetical protein